MRQINGGHIKAFRALTDITQPQLAEKLGFSTRALQYHEQALTRAVTPVGSGAALDLALRAMLEGIPGVPWPIERYGDHVLALALAAHDAEAGLFTEYCETTLRTPPPTALRLVG